MASLSDAPAAARGFATERSAELFARAERVMPSGYTRDLVAQLPHPQYASHAQGCWLTDIDGNRRIDWVNNFTSMIHGHAPPAVVRVIAEQAGRLMNAVLPTEWEVGLAEHLVDRVPGIDRIRFTNSGTEANAIAVKAARAFTGRSKVAKIEGGYHGQFDLLEASHQPTAPLWGPAERPVPVPHNPATPQSLLDELVILPLNDIANGRAILAERAAELAAVIIDPWRLQAGMVSPRRDYLEMLREETARLGIVLIFDEVVSLRASHGGAQGLYGILPDLTTLGKIIGGGLPIGGVGGSAAVMSVFEMGRPDGKVKHSGTFTANPLSMATGLTSMRLLTRAALEDLSAKSERLREGLRRAIRDTGLPGDVTGDGSVSALMLTDQPTENFRQFAHALQNGLMARLLALQALLTEESIFTLRGNFIGSTPMTDDDVDFTIAGATRAMRRLAEA